MIEDIKAFLGAVVTRWTTFVSGSFVVIAPSVASSVAEKQLPGYVYAIFFIFGVLIATFGPWREQRRRADGKKQELDAWLNQKPKASVTLDARRSWVSLSIRNDGAQAKFHVLVDSSDGTANRGHLSWSHGIPTADCLIPSGETYSLPIAEFERDIYTEHDLGHEDSDEYDDNHLLGTEAYRWRWTQLSSGNRVVSKTSLMPAATPEWLHLRLVVVSDPPSAGIPPTLGLSMRYGKVIVDGSGIEVKVQPDDGPALTAKLMAEMEAEMEAEGYE